MYSIFNLLSILKLTLKRGTGNEYKVIAVWLRILLKIQTLR